MKIDTLGATIRLEASDYFYVSEDGADLQLTLTCNNRHPIKIRHVSRKQLFNLISQSQKIMLAQDEDKVGAIVERHEDTDDEWRDGIVDMCRQKMSDDLEGVVL